jgi:hypothetical protein
LQAKGHPGVSNAAASILESFYGDDVAFTATSAGLPGVEQSFTSFSGLGRDPLPLRL